MIAILPKVQRAKRAHEKYRDHGTESRYTIELLVNQVGYSSLATLKKYCIVTRSLFKINLHAARGPRNQTRSFYTDCQRNVTTQTHVSL